MKKLLWMIPVALPIAVLLLPGNNLNSLDGLLIFAGFCCLVSAFGLFYRVFKHPAVWVIASLFLAVGLFVMDIGIGFFAACVYPGIK
jgi:hypothetical protein